MKTVKIAAIHNGGGYDRSVLAIAMDLDDHLDPEKAIEAAVTRYLQTEDGREACHGYMGYGDFVELVPRDILLSCGIHDVRTEAYGLVVDQDANLVPLALYDG